MLKKKIEELSRKFDPDIQRVVLRVIEMEQAKLSYEKPHGIKEEIRKIIEEEAREL